MAAPVAKSASVDVWNRLLDVSDGDGLAVERLIFQARGMVARRSSDLYAQMGLAFGLLLRGSRSEAMPHIDAACRLRVGGSDEDHVNLAALLTNCGRLDDARSVLDQLLHRVGNRVPDICGTAWLVAFMSGDLSLFDRAAAVARVSGSIEQDFVAMLRDLELEDAFREHQSTVMNAAGSHCCYIQARVMTDPDDGFLVLGIDLFTNFSEDDQIDLYGQIAARQSDIVGTIAPYVGFNICGPKFPQVPEVGI